MTEDPPAPKKTMAPVVGRLRGRASFRALGRPHGRATRDGVTVAYCRPEAGQDVPHPLVAYAIGRRHGGAVVRNRLRRRLRAAVYGTGPRLAAGSYLVRAEPWVVDAPFSEVERAVTDAALAAGKRGALR